MPFRAFTARTVPPPEPSTTVIRSGDYASSVGLTEGIVLQHSFHESATRGIVSSNGQYDLRRGSVPDATGEPPPDLGTVVTGSIVFPEDPNAVPPGFALHNGVYVSELSRTGILLFLLLSTIVLVALGIAVVSDIIRIDSLPRWSGAILFIILPLSLAVLQATPTFRVIMKDEAKLIRISYGSLLYRVVGGCECCSDSNEVEGEELASSGMAESATVATRDQSPQPTPNSVELAPPNEVRSRDGFFSNASAASAIVTQKVGCGGVLIDIPYECVREIRLRVDDSFGYSLEDEEDGAEGEEEVYGADIELGLGEQRDHRRDGTGRVATGSNRVNATGRRRRVARQPQPQSSLTWSVYVVVLCQFPSPPTTNMTGSGATSEVDSGIAVGTSSSGAPFRRCEKTFKIATFSLPTKFEQFSQAQTRGGAPSTGSGARAMNDVRTESSVVLKYRQFCAARFPHCVVRPPWVAARPISDEVRPVAPTAEASPLP